MKTFTFGFDIAGLRDSDAGLLLSWASKPLLDEAVMKH
jgi:hypothetical protein